MNILFDKIPFQKPSLTPIFETIFKEKNIHLSILELQNIHPSINGNKWFKLKYNLQHAYNEGIKTIVSVGGAYSNHLHALAHACKELGFDGYGIIRADENLENKTLVDLKASGMKLIQVSREDYRQKNEEWFFEKYIKPIDNTFIYIPEGGSNALALKGIAELKQYIPDNTNYVITAVGSTGTVAGLGLAFDNSQTKVIGIAALKGGSFLTNDIEKLYKQAQITVNQTPEIITDYHFGGFGKTKPSLFEFIYHFEDKHNIKLEQVYTAKMLYGVYELIEKNYFSEGSKIVAIHTGGLQGRYI